MAVFLRYRTRTRGPYLLIFSVFCSVLLPFNFGAYTQTVDRSDRITDTPIVRITQRYDLRRSINSVYQGIFFGYSLGTWNLGPAVHDGTGPGQGRRVNARYYVSEESISDLNASEKLLSGEEMSTFTLLPNGGITGAGRNDYPLMRGFPSAPPFGIAAGKTWVAPLELVLPGNAFAGHRKDGKETLFKLLAEYTFKGPATWLGRPVIEITAKFAVRYRAGQDSQGDTALQNVEGTRDATIYLDPITMAPVYTRERVGNETYRYSDGMVIQQNGFIITFYEGSLPLGRDDEVRIAGILEGNLTGPGNNASPGPGNTSPIGTSPTDAVNPDRLNSLPTGPSSSPGAAREDSPGGTSQSIPGSSSSPQPGTLLSQQSEDPMHSDNLDIERGPLRIANMTVEHDPRGIAITLEQLRFEADTARLLPGDEHRLDRMASVLKTFPERSILVVGHTAAVGTTESQDSLSRERARVIVEALKKRGIEARRLLFEGRGGREPLATNETEQGRAQNRRVQVIILD